MEDVQLTPDHPKARPSGTAADAESARGPKPSKVTPEGPDAVVTDTL
jgi:hypothetical protein